MARFQQGFGSMYQMDDSTVNFGRDRHGLEEDKYALYYDRHMFQINGVLDLLTGPASNWMIYQTQATEVFQLAKVAMDQWLRDVRVTQQKYTEDEMEHMDMDLYLNMGNPVLWAGVLCHKVIRAGDVWDRFYAGVRKDDWTMKAVHSHCKKHKHHRFWDVRRDGQKTYHTLRLRSLGKRKDRKPKAQKLSSLLEAAGCGPLEEAVMNMAELEEVERPPGGLTVSCADELWRRWKDRRESEHADRVRHATLCWQADQASEKAGHDRVIRLRQQRLALAHDEDSDFTDDDDDYEATADPELVNVTGRVVDSDGGSQSYIHDRPGEVARAESNDLMLNPPSAHDRYEKDNEEDVVVYDKDGEEAVPIRNGVIDPAQMERDYNRIQNKRNGMALLRSHPVHEGEFNMPSDDDYDFEEEANDHKRSRATMRYDC